VKLGDFGFSAFTTADQTLSTFCGSPPYAAPELFRDHSYLGPNVDVWAMGVLLFFITTALLPFRGETIAKLKKVIYEGAYTMPEHLSDDCQFLIRGILRGTPQDRFTLDEVRRSAWLAGEHFPPANSPYPMNPSLTPANAGSVASSDSGAGGGTGSAEPADMSNSVSGDNTADTTVGNKVTATSVAAAAARQRLVDEFGIRPEQLRRSQVDGPRNNVTGMFRIVMHQMDKRNNVGSLDDSCLPDSASGPAGVQQAYARAWNCQAGPALDGHRIATRRKQSKMCVIF
jgi:serine/threonine protein kinase